MLSFLVELQTVLKKAPGFKDIQTFENAESGLEPEIQGVVPNVCEKDSREQR